MTSPWRIVILGLSITSSWGNGHATTFRGLVRELAARGHDVLFLERDVPWYASQRDLPHPPYGRTELYASLADLEERFAPDVHEADVVIVGSYVPEGVEAMLRSSGLRITARPQAESYLCELDPANPSSVRTWNAGEFNAATALNARLTKTLRFRHCWVNVAPGYAETCFHDGTRVTAVHEDSDEYRGKAARYGYGDDLAGLSRDHEILHTFLAEALGYGASPTLWAVAHGQQGGVAPYWEQVEEEAWTLAFQTYLQGGPPAEPLRRLTDAGLDLETLREQARKLLR